MMYPHTQPQTMKAHSTQFAMKAPITETCPDVCTTVMINARCAEEPVHAQAGLTVSRKSMEKDAAQFRRMILADFRFRLFRNQSGWTNRYQYGLLGGGGGRFGYAR